MIDQELIPNETAVKQTIADRTRELNLLRSILRALDRYRTESKTARNLREAAKITNGGKSDG